MGSRKPKTPLVLPAPKTDEALARRNFRQRIARDQETFSDLVEEGSRLMDRVRVPSSVRQVPNWLLPLAAYSLKHGLRHINYPENYHRDLYEAIIAGFNGDFVTVEMWIMAHEYDD